MYIEKGRIMSTYMFGRSVTAMEKAFLSRVLVEPTRLEQGKHFNMIRNIAIKNDISIEKAHELLEEKKAFVAGLNANNVYKREKFSIDKYGNLIKKNLYTNRTEIVPEDTFISADGTRKPCPIKKQSKFVKVLKYIGTYIREMFTVY